MVKLMVTFFSETSTSRLNSDNLKTLIALQNGLKWLLLHSRFSKFSEESGGGPRTTYKKAGKTSISSTNPTLFPHSVTKWSNDTFSFYLPVIAKIRSLWFVIRNFIYWQLVTRSTSCSPPPPFSCITVFFLSQTYQRFLLEANSFID